MKIDWLIDCTPRPVQIEALARSFYGVMGHENRDQEISYVRFNDGPSRGWCHFMEMRLGKTPTTFNEFMLYKRHHGIKNLVMLAPNSYKEAWVLEAVKFGVDTPFFAYETSCASEAERFVKMNPDGFGLVLNYESLIYPKTLKLLENILNNETMFGADESIKIKNPQALTAKYAVGLSKKAGVRRALTGLPMTQGPQDFFMQFKFVGAYDGSNFYGFRNRYCKMGGFKGKKIVGPNNEEELSRRMKLFSFVAKRKDWGKITVPEYYNVPLTITKEQAEKYQQMDKDFITVLDNGQEVSADMVITQMAKLQQISSGFVYTDEGEMVRLVDPDKVPKIVRLKELLEDEISGKVVVPFFYKESGNILSEALAKYKPANIRSSMWMKQNGLNLDDEKKRFNTDPECRVALVQIVAGKYGHDLSGSPGDRCCYTVFYENTYSLDDRGQIEMRNTASDQDWINVYMDFVGTPIEEKAVAALVKKENIVTAVLGAYNDFKERLQRD